ncbi:MAG: hypothetical protein Q8Q88_20305 [Phenylobacterium sp.]|uniref:hypothetical protein n=1 Tax=Phenylobacterium sp. TaxID=1871053 RepID=UPI002734E241|nr:hypothetical protein [Phenylobacterium sp.]MDP3749386.1 hypothetical protein [Phenylobacterium sp.]
MLRESLTAVVARNETWTGASATEPYEAGWASEAVIFVRALEAAKGEMAQAFVEISPDGMRWIREGASLVLPAQADDLAVARVSHFGNWLRLAATLPDGAECTLLVTLHLK